MYWHKHDRSRVIFLLNSLFDAGSITYWGLWGIGQLAPSLTFQSLIQIYFALAVVVYGLAVFFWTFAAPLDGNHNDDDEVEEDQEEEAGNPTEDADKQLRGCGGEALVAASSNSSGPQLDEHVLSIRRDAVVSFDDDEDGAGKSCLEGIGKEAKVERDSQQMLVRAQSDADGDGVDDVVVDDDGNNMNSSMDVICNLRVGEEASSPRVIHKRDILRKFLFLRSDDADDYVCVADRTTYQQLTSFPYMMLLLFFGINVASNQWNLTTQRDFLAYMGDDEVGNKYLTIFTLLLPVSICGLPFVDAAILHLGFAGAFQCINALALAYMLVKISSDDLNVQIIGFVLFSFYRSFLFGVTFSFLPTILGASTMGQATGVMYFVAGFCAFVNIPLSKVAVERLDGNFFITNLVYTFLVLPCVLAAWGIGRVIRRERRAKDLASRQMDTDHPDRLRASYGGILLTQRITGEDDASSDGGN